MGRGATADQGAAIAPARHQAGDEFAAQRAEVQDILRMDSDLFSNHVALITLIGSRAYGMATSDSDADYRGVYVANSEDLLGLDQPQPQFERKDPDITVFELGKFCNLAMAANPNILEALWSPVLHASHVGQRLRLNRHLFVSQHARTTYVGFAHSQLRRVESHERSGAIDKRAKSALHLFRAFEQAEGLLRNGEIEVRANDPEELRSLAKLPLPEIKERFAELDQRLRHMPSELPMRADREKISNLVYQIRLERIEHDLDPGRAAL